MTLANNETPKAVDHLTAEAVFWRSAEQGQLVLPRCIETGKCFFYPRDHSPFTGGKIDWVKSDGEGIVYSYCVSGKSGEPYCLAYIELNEGPIILSNVLADDLSRIEIGQRVKVCFLPDGKGRKAPYFKLEE